MTTPEELVETLRELELAAEEVGVYTFIGLRADMDGSRARLRDAGMNAEQQGAIIMASIIVRELGANPVIWNLFKDDVLRAVVSALVALK